MATTCPVGFDTRRLREEVARIYASVAHDPSGEFHFHRGPGYASQRLGYDAGELDRLPATSTASFAGVANPLAIASPEPGQTVVDVGCGAGMDLLLAARAVGPEGRAIGVDMTPSMRERAHQAALLLELEQVEVLDGDVETLPIDEGMADVVISNGVINLATDKQAAFAEIFRVLRPGGRLQLGDIVVSEELSEAIRNNIDLWTS